MSFPKTPHLAVDCVVFDPKDRLLLIRRKNPPFQGSWALPGGFVEIGETVENACLRELLEETGIVGGALTLIGVYSAPDRDPRGHICSAAFLAEPEGGVVKAGSDARVADWVQSWREVDFAFDHRQIVLDALRKRNKT